MFVIGMLFGEPTLDYSSPKAYRESCEEILEYLGGDLKDKDAEDWTEDDRETFAQIVVLVNFLQHEHSKELREQIDGMSANELLDFVTENYSIGL